MSPEQVFRISRAAKEELWVLVTLASWVFTNLRAQASEVVDAVDASSAWVAVGDTQVSADMAQEMWRSRNRKGGYVRMLTSVGNMCAHLVKSDDPEDRALGEAEAERLGQPVEGSVSEQERSRSELVGDFARGQQFVQRLKYRVLPGEHINIKKGKAIGSSLRRDAGNPARHDKRALKLSDS